jgi:hypothetical protein
MDEITVEVNANVNFVHGGFRSRWTTFYFGAGFHLSVSLSALSATGSLRTSPPFVYVQTPAVVLARIGPMFFFARSPIIGE